MPETFVYASPERAPALRYFEALHDGVGVDALAVGELHAGAVEVDGLVVVGDRPLRGERGDRLAVLVERDQGVVDGGQVRTVKPMSARAGSQDVTSRKLPMLRSSGRRGGGCSLACVGRLRRRSSW
jgi:hypothetical protein